MPGILLDISLKFMHTNPDYYAHGWLECKNKSQFLV